MEEEANIATETLAEMYLKGENIEKACEIYRQLLKQNPGSAKFREKVRELELRLGQSGGVAPRGSEYPKGPESEVDPTIGKLKEWLRRIQQARKKSI
jgi:hypothetical protein